MRFLLCISHLSRALVAPVSPAPEKKRGLPRAAERRAAAAGRRSPGCCRPSRLTEHFNILTDLKAADFAPFAFFRSGWDINRDVPQTGSAWLISCGAAGLPAGTATGLFAAPFSQGKLLEDLATAPALAFRKGLVYFSSFVCLSSSSGSKNTWLGVTPTLVCVTFGIRAVIAIPRLAQMLTERYARQQNSP